MDAKELGTAAANAVNRPRSLLRKQLHIRASELLRAAHSVFLSLVEIKRILQICDPQKTNFLAS